MKKQIKDFTPGEIVDILVENYKNQGYEVDVDSNTFHPARVSVFCKKLEEEKIIEYIIDRDITKKRFFPPEVIEGIEIKESSPAIFFQYYFPTAKIYLAFPYYVDENDGFSEFKKTCDKNGIGLIKINKALQVEEISESKPLFNKICTELEITDDKKRDKLEYYLRNCLTYFIYYPYPVFRRRAITGKAKERMSLILIDKLVDLKNIHYKDKLIELANNYRKEFRDDYEIAGYYITYLWDQNLGLKYPSIQKRAENILQRDQVYREHFVHQFQVFLIGAYILDSMYNEVAEKFENTHSCKIEDVWLAASTFHDFSYGLQNFDTWLMDFFEEILRIKSIQTKKNLNLLNLDAAMIRETLYDQIQKMVHHLGGYTNKKNKYSILIKFFYEKAVRDRNHGVLSAITLLKLFEETDISDRKIIESGIVEAATSIACHDEDIWELLAGCKGYLHGELPTSLKECISKCRRKPWHLKRANIFIEESLLLSTNFKNGIEPTCETWEREIMDEKIISKINFKSNPILFLLTFCDTIQDEGRVSNADDQTLIDRSTLELINIISNKGKAKIHVNLKSDDVQKKIGEVERLAWVLKDSRFLIGINQEPIRAMNGKGGL